MRYKNTVCMTLHNTQTVKSYFKMHFLFYCRFVEETERLRRAEANDDKEIDVKKES